MLCKAIGQKYAVADDDDDDDDDDADDDDDDDDDVKGLVAGAVDVDTVEDFATTPESTPDDDDDDDDDAASLSTHFSLCC